MTREHPSRPRRTTKRPRARDLGIRIGVYPTGRHNAITDVPGVRVGHCTRIEGEGALVPGEGPIRTGVTAIFPTRANVFDQRVVGSGFVLNGAGEVAGLTQVNEWGLIETPIVLTNTLAVGQASDAVVRWMVERNPGIGDLHDVIIPVVGECDDSWLNDATGRHIRAEQVWEALDSAKAGAVVEGSVGGGTGMVTCDFKAGIGTSSRKLPVHEGGFVVGVLVMSNFGRREDLRIDGWPAGRWLAPGYARDEVRKTLYGSIIAVVGTNAPLLPHQLQRLCKRAALGIGRVGSYAAHGSGEIIVGFSNANTVPRDAGKGMTYKLEALWDERMDPLYRAVIEATEESILNALCAADEMTGHSGHKAPGIPRDLLARWFGEGRLPESPLASHPAMR